MFKIAIGHSEDPDSNDAISQVLSQCETTLGGSKPSAGILFCSPEHDQESILSAINQKYRGLELIGCTSCGEISSTDGYSEGTVLLALFSSDRVRIHASVVRKLTQATHFNFVSAVTEAMGNSGLEPALCIMLPDIFSIGMVQIVNHLEDILGMNVPIIGGGASDPWRFDQTAQFYKTEVLHDSAPILIFSGPLDYTVNVASGWEPFTVKKMILKHEKSVISSIGDLTALDFYKNYLGGNPSLAYPLAVFQGEEDHFYLRAPIGVNEETGQVIVGGDIPPFEMACCIANANPDNLLTVMKTLVQDTLKTVKDYNGAFLISCACRQQILGTETKKESDIIQDVFTAEKPCFGFYSYSQSSPFEKYKRTFVHNETVVLLVLGEKHEP